MIPNAALADSDIQEYDMRKYYHSNDTVSLGILDVLGLIFIVLKLVGVIKWSWLWVLAPWWIPILIVLIEHFTYWIND